MMVSKKKCFRQLNFASQSDTKAQSSLSIMRNLCIELALVNYFQQAVDAINVLKHDFIVA